MTTLEEWQEQMNEKLSELSSLIRDRPPGALWYIEENLDTTEMNDFDSIRTVATGWRTFTIRYFVDPRTQNMPSQSLIGES